MNKPGMLSNLKYHISCLILSCTPCLLNAQTAAENRPAFARDNMNAVLWQQRSGEYRALAFQAYNLARYRLDEALKVKKHPKPLCVVVDIDETVLNNSAFEGHELHQGVSYDQNDWLEWTSKAAADTVPGACSFLKYAAKKGVEVFYITNRGKTEFQATLKNLQQFKFPYTDARHLMVKDNTSDKQPRREQVAATYEIVLFCGDNLNDFNDLFYQKDQESRNAAVDRVRKLFGERFIILPNPTYGDWEPPVYENKKGLTEQEKADKRMEAIRQY